MWRTSMIHPIWVENGYFYLTALGLFMVKNMVLTVLCALSETLRAPGLISHCPDDCYDPFLLF